MLKRYQLLLLVPKPLKDALRYLSFFKLFSDPRSVSSFNQVYSSQTADTKLPERIDLRIRMLKNKAITIRTKGTDARVLFTAYFHKFHVPTVPISSKAPLIFDLGANIGCTMAHLATLYPAADIVGVEMDSGNAEICRKNVSPWAERCQLVEGAVWYEDGSVQYEAREGIEDGYSIDAAAGNSEGLVEAKAYSLNSLVDRFAGNRSVDYMKMDIEGAEKYVLSRNTEWAAKVDAIKVELHGEYSIDQCVSDLSAMGFDSWADTRHNLCVVGFRNSRQGAGRSSDAVAAARSGS